MRSAEYAEHRELNRAEEDAGDNTEFVLNPDHCNCSRQSILYILSHQEPDSEFEVDILDTILNGAEHCRFRITKK